MSNKNQLLMSAAREAVDYFERGDMTRFHQTLRNIEDFNLPRPMIKATFEALNFEGDISKYYKG